MEPRDRTAPPIALTIAGSDSGGGAGIQADLKTFHQFGVFGTSVVTAVTAQNTLGVRAVHSVPLETVQAQIDALAEDLPPAALKTGMLGTAEHVRLVADALERLEWSAYVLDPVMIATSGDRLLDEDAERTIAERLLPLAALVTPNAPEAAVLVGRPVETVADLRAAADTLLEMGARAALVKGGHLRMESPDEVVDVFMHEGQQIEWRHARVRTSNTHGTGCTLSAAATAGLAHGRPMQEAAAAAVTFTVEAIRRAPDLGTGNGPISHFAPPPRWANGPGAAIRERLPR